MQATTFPNEAPAVKETHVFNNEGLGNLLATPGLYFCTVVRGFASHLSFGVYMTHGTPGGKFYKNSMPIRSFDSQREANEFIDQLAGLVDAHKAFANNVFER